MVDWDKLDLIRGDLEDLAGLFFLRKMPVRPVGDINLDDDMGFGLVLTLGVETNLEAEISFGEDLRADKLTSSPDSFFWTLFSLLGEALGVVLTVDLGEPSGSEAWTF